ncbi:hypothetical protein ASD24_02865 [Paenibacillus sp. Root52]|uniref:GntP family permease n=1 Tax=Paenibacillus sp. Root52 TaxID=1736552 RepID=UPI0007021D7F|nr:SLC13 family permease [Paenibacillus sp. Root52]KQY94512.1 hypothetical protein ASD24_02865 [Paenibacillus sp. Root52]
MTPTIFIIILIAAVIMLTFGTLKLKIHPVIALFLTSIFLGLCFGNSLLETLAKINEFFGSTLSGVAITIIFGAVIAIGIQDTGASTSIANFFIKLFKGKRLELAPSLTSFMVALSVFGDIAMVLTAPISSILAKRKKINMAKIAPYVNLGLTLPHGLLPPHPGILAVALLLGADLGKVILWGTIICVASFVITYMLTIKKMSKVEFIEPLPEFSKEIETVQENATIKELYIKEDNTPSTWTSFMPLIVPVVLISAGSFGKMIFEEGSYAYAVLSTVGDKVFALFVGVILMMFLILGRKPKVIKVAKKNEPISENSSILEISTNNWLTRALKIAIMPLIVTGMGGAMGGMLRENPVIDELGMMVAGTDFPKLLIPFILSAILMAVCGSMTIASMTAAALVAPMLGILGISPVAATLAVGAGSMVFWHVNNSGFWIMTSLYNFNTKQGLKYFTTINGLGGIVAFAILCILSILGWA